MQFIEELQPDILCLQEVCSSELWTPYFPGLAGYEEIAKALPGHEGYFSACEGAPMFGGRCEFGNAIFSKYPLKNKETFFINGEYAFVQNLTKDISNIRNLQRVTLETPEGDLCLLNHHAYWVPDEFGNDVSVMKMRKVAKIVQESPRPLILSGDFNVVSESKALMPVQEHLRDLTRDYEVLTTLTRLNKMPNIACDHIFVSHGIEVRDFVVKEKAIISDHLPLVMEFKLAR